MRWNDRPRDLRERVGERGLADARDVLDQQVAARQQAGEAQPDLRVLAEDDAVELGEDRARSRRLVALMAVAARSACSAATRASCATSWSISRAQLGERAARSLATTSAGALRANSPLRELGLRACRSSRSALRRRLASRSSSAAGSIRPAIGTRISSLPSSATAAIGAASPGREHAARRRGPRGASR